MLKANEGSLKEPPRKHIAHQALKLHWFIPFKKGRIPSRWKSNVTNIAENIDFKYVKVFVSENSLTEQNYPAVLHLR